MKEPDIHIRLRFASLDERDAFIEEHFPTRRCWHAPGYFKIPSWGFIHVFCESVTLRPLAWVLKAGRRPQ